MQTRLPFTYFTTSFFTFNTILTQLYYNTATQAKFLANTTDIKLASSKQNMFASQPHTPKGLGNQKIKTSLFADDGGRLAVVYQSNMVCCSSRMDPWVRVSSSDRVSWAKRSRSLFGIFSKRRRLMTAKLEVICDSSAAEKHTSWVL